MNDASVALSVVDPGPPPGRTAVYVTRHAHVLQTGLSACFHGGTHNGARGGRDIAMQAIHTQRDLAGLPEPRFINAPPDWLRWFATGMLLCAAVFAGAACAVAIGNGNIFLAAGSALATGLCLAVVVYARPTDWLSWVNLAATADGLYLVAQRRRVVFVPWRDVVAISARRIAGPHLHAELTLRLPEETWAQFGNLSGIKGSGSVRRYALSALVMPGEELVGKLTAFRDAVC